MPVKKSILHALSSAALASLACVIYNTIYSKAFELNFSVVLNIGGIVSACVFACVLMAAAYYIGIKWRGDKATRWINMGIAVLSFVSIIGVLGFQLPMDVENPELFPGLAIPMHFFPAFSFLVVYPFFT